MHMDTQTHYHKKSSFSLATRVLVYRASTLSDNVMATFGGNPTSTRCAWENAGAGETCRVPPERGDALRRGTTAKDSWRRGMGSLGSKNVFVELSPPKK